MPAGGVRLDGGPVPSEPETSFVDTDASSVISISDRLGPSDTEEEGEAWHDRHKYRLPDVGKTRLHLRTKEPLSPSPRSPRRGAGGGAGAGSMSGPATPREGREGGGASGNGSRLARAGSGYFAGANGSSENVSDSDFVPSGLSRAGSIYTLGRASLQGQLSHLTSLRLPDASSLAKRISSIPTSTEAAKALSDASDQIRLWITKASDVLNGLSAEDDVEWAAAGGREGIEDVDAAIRRFETLIEVYVLSIERLQTRGDIDALPAEDLMGVVHQMEIIVTSWSGIKADLKGVKLQVEIAMEWEELWNTTLGQIAQEMEGLERLVFEMEERRHAGAEGILSSRDSIDISELETIVEEKPGKITAANDKRLSIPPFSPTEPIQPPPPNAEKDDSSLLGLFARMQPLRASLDFLPMRLAAFHNRGKAVFPSACEDLESRRDQLELNWKKLEYDAESLRRELGEDRWVLVFRNAGRQALKMCESVERSCVKLHESVEASEWDSNLGSFGKKVESFEAKKFHYGPAIERVLAIIDRGVADRLTVNGEILRLQSDMRDRWSALQAELMGLESTLESLNLETAREKQLRDSVSTVTSSERASVASSFVDRLDTPGSSPASSVVGTSRKSSFQGSRTPTPLTNGKTRQCSTGPRSSIPRRIPLTQSGEFRSTPSPSPLTMRMPSPRAASMNDSPVSQRPRWVGGKKIENRDFLPLSALEPSPYAKTPVVRQTNYLRSTSTPTAQKLPILTRTPMTSKSRTVSTTSSLVTPSPSSRLAAPSTLPRAASSLQPSRKSSLPIPTLATATPSRAATAMASKRALSAAPPLRTPSRQARQDVSDGNEADSESPAHHKGRSRPPSALAGRRSSMLPTRRAGSGMQQRAGLGAGDGGGGGEGERPPWRP